MQKNHFLVRRNQKYFKCPALVITNTDGLGRHLHVKVVGGAAVVVVVDDGGEEQGEHLEVGEPVLKDKMLHSLKSMNLSNVTQWQLFAKPFHPTGPFLAPKLIILFN